MGSLSHGLCWVLGLTCASVVQAECGSVGVYQVITVAYAGDAPANAVLDKNSGLQWRRCEEGQRWSGVACLGVGEQLTHEQALLHVAKKSMWQLPDVKQITSLAQRACRFPALHSSVFVTGELSSHYWSSTPFVSDSRSAWRFEVNTGRVNLVDRDKRAGVRVLRR